MVEVDTSRYADECMFKDEQDGVFKRCRALVVDECPKNCKFKKTEIDFYCESERAEKRLQRLGLKPYVRTDADGVKIMSVRKWGE